MRCEIAPDRGRSQKLLDSFGFVESLVDPKPDLRCEFQVNVPRDLAAQEALVALERGEHRVRVAAAERHHVDGREPQVGGHAHLGNGDEMAFDHGIVHLAAREHVRERMAHELAHAQLALRGRMVRAGIALVASPGHGILARGRIRETRPSEGGKRMTQYAPSDQFLPGFLDARADCAGHDGEGRACLQSQPRELTASVAPSPLGSIR